MARPDDRGVIYASAGFGPLLMRDYFAAIEGADDCTPERIGELIRCRFEEFAPTETAHFRRDKRTKALEVGDELDIKLALLGRCRVRVVQGDERGLTLRTMAGHPEAGRITFAGGRDDRGRPTFRIGSRTRANGLPNLAGFLVMGKQMQARCWINFAGNVAAASGGRVERAVLVRTLVVDETPADRPGGPDEPVFPIVEAGRRAPLDEGGS